MGMNKDTVLLAELTRREDEYQEYQINIDNFTLAIALIEKEHPNDTDLLLFRDELQQRLAEEKRQQNRTRILRDVIKQQIPGASNVS